MSKTPLFYTRADLAYADVARFAQSLIKTIGASDERYEIVDATLAECRIAPKPRTPCNVVHVEELDERVTRFADHVFAAVVTDEGVHAALTAVLLNIFAEYTSLAPIAHLTSEQQREYALCTAADWDGIASQYDDCARRRAHVAGCEFCSTLLQQFRLDTRRSQ